MCVCLIRYNRNEGGKSRIAKQKSEKTQRMRKDVNEGRQKCEKSVYAAQLKRRKRTTKKKKHITHDRNLHSHAASPELYTCLSNIALSQTI